MRFRWSAQTRSVQSFANANGNWSTRASVIVMAETAEGAYGIGEATPLPGYSPDTVADVLYWLQGLGSNPWTPDAALQPDAVLRQLATRLDTHVNRPPPSGLFALQTACLDLWSKLRGTTVSAECSKAWSGTDVSPGVAPPDSSDHLCVAPVLDAHSTSFEQTAMGLCSRGYTTFKVKVGMNLPLEFEALERLHTLALASGTQVNFRLDANQSINPVELDAALRPFKRLSVEYIEEPCSLEGLSPEQELPLPLALDESLRLEPAKLAPWLRPGRLAAVVFKPMVAGGVTSALDWSAHCRRMACPFVVSHLFDGPIAFQLYAVLARALEPNGCHGLFPHAGLAAWKDWVYPTQGPGLGLELTPLAQRTLRQAEGATR